MTSPLDYSARLSYYSSDEEERELGSTLNDEVTSNHDPGSGLEDLEYERAEASSSGNQATTSAFIEVDYSKTQQPAECHSLEDMPKVKVYRVKRKQGAQDISIVRIHKNNLKDVITVLSQKLDISKGDKSRVRFTYPLRTTDGAPEYITVHAWDNDLAEALELFYCQTENQSLLEVDISAKRPKRPPRPSEENKKKMIKHGAMDKTMYKLCQDDPEMAETLLFKRRYLAVLLGDEEAVNLLNPSRFLCHVQSCAKLLKLKSYCNLSTITEHWKNHTKSTVGEPSCDKLLSRHNHVKRIHKTPWKAAVTVEELEKVPELDLKMMMRGKLVVKAGQKFKGKYLLMEKDVLEKIVAYDPTALADVHQDTTVEDVLGS